MSDWQDIETAPRDGTVFVIGRDDSSHHAFSGIGVWRNGRFRDPTDWPAKYWHDPTHWKPIDAPPSLGRAG